MAEVTRDVAGFKDASLAYTFDDVSGDLLRLNYNHGTLGSAWQAEVTARLKDRSQSWTVDGVQVNRQISMAGRNLKLVARAFEAGKFTPDFTIRCEWTRA